MTWPPVSRARTSKILAGSLKKSIAVLNPDFFVITGGSSETFKEPPWICPAVASVAPFQLTQAVKRPATSVGGRREPAHWGWVTGPVEEENLVAGGARREPSVEDERGLDKAWRRGVGAEEREEVPLLRGWRWGQLVVALARGVQLRGEMTRLRAGPGHRSIELMWNKSK